MAVREVSYGSGELPHANSAFDTKFLKNVDILATDVDSNDDQVLLYPFGDEAGRLHTLAINGAALDSGGTAALSVDFGIGDSDGVIDTAIATGQTAIVQGTGTAEFDFFPIDVQNKFLIMDATVAAQTAAAGTIGIFGEVAGPAVSAP